MQTTYSLGTIPLAMSDEGNQLVKNIKDVQITPEMERRMRIIANLIIDKIFEDKLNNTLKFQSNTHTKKKANNV